MAARGLQSQFRRSPPYASCIDRCRTVHHDAFTTPNSHRGARRASAVASGGFLDNLCSRGEPPSPQRQGDQLQGDQRPAEQPRVAQADPGDLSIRLDRIESALRQLTGTLEQLQYRNQQLEERLKRMQEDTEYRFQQLGSKGAPPAGAAPRAMAPPAPVN